MTLLQTAPAPASGLGDFLTLAESAESAAYARAFAFDSPITATDPFFDGHAGFDDQETDYPCADSSDSTGDDPGTSQKLADDLASRADACDDPRDVDTRILRTEI